MALTSTTWTGKSVDEYIASRANESQRADCTELMAMFSRITDHPPMMWGPSIVGYGTYRYTYDSGHTGEAPLGAFAIRGRDLVVYIMGEERKQNALLAKLGKHRMGKSCLYFKRLSDVDRDVLEQLVVNSIETISKRYPV